jgi:hypothetical protein
MRELASVDAFEEREGRISTMPSVGSGAEQLANQIKATIRRVTNGRIHNLDVVLTGTHVVLEGFCSSFHPFQLAQHAAMQLAEDFTVDNQIDVC